MLFREFNIIAAAAYAAQCAAEPKPERLLWDELDEDQQMQFTQAVMAVARGEATAVGDVFTATAKAILEYNGGQGGLALEEIANIGGAVLNLELLSEDEVKDRNIRETVVELLHELAGRRQGGSGLSAARSDADMRMHALQIAIGRTQACKREGKPSPIAIVEQAAAFYEFLNKGTESAWTRASALTQASDIVEPHLRPVAVVLVAEDLLTFLEPAKPEVTAAPEWPVDHPANGAEEIPAEQAETIQ